MQKITSLVSVADIAPYMDEKVLNYIRSRSAGKFGQLQFFCVLGVCWYDIHSEDNNSF